MGCVGCRQCTGTLTSWKSRVEYMCSAVQCSAVEKPGKPGPKRHAIWSLFISININIVDLTLL